jgi:CubicO group peptidase (beta-lactamase class C family)
MITAEVSGRCDTRFAPVRDTFAEQLASGEELGASIVVDLDGETVVDLWGGWHDAERTTLWTQNPIVNVLRRVSGRSLTDFVAQELAGSLIVADLDRRLTISYMMNRMAPGIIGSDRSEAYVRAVDASLAA